jgi:hypothetical protein
MIGRPKTCHAIDAVSEPNRFLIADVAGALHLATMREPIGTTRKGQVLLGVAGLLVGVGGSFGLEVRPDVFEPILRAALYGIGALARIHTHYDPSERTLYAVLLSTLGIFWAALLGYAFVREPARDRMIDAYLRRHDELDQGRRATIISQDDRLFERQHQQHTQPKADGVQTIPGHSPRTFDRSF